MILSRFKMAHQLKLAGTQAKCTKGPFWTKLECTEGPFWHIYRAVWAKGPFCLDIMCLISLEFWRAISFPKTMYRLLLHYMFNLFFLYFFSGNNLWTLPKAVFCSLSSLNSLDLSGNFIQDVSDLGFASSQLNSCRIPLRNLDLSHNSLSTLASKGIFL